MKKILSVVVVLFVFTHHSVFCLSNATKIGLSGRRAEQNRDDMSRMRRELNELSEECEKRAKDAEERLKRLPEEIKRLREEWEAQKKRMAEVDAEVDEILNEK